MPKKTKSDLDESRLLDLFAEYQALSAQVSELTKQKDKAAALLKAMIPAGESRAGIQHVVSYGKSVSYAKALADIREQLIPKTRQSDVETILAAYTTQPMRSTFKAVVPE